MKIRNNFISNSSSASFIILWRLPNANIPPKWEYRSDYETNPESVIDDILDWSLDENEKAYIKNHTKPTHDPEIFKTEIRVAMYNDMASFSHELNHFHSQLMVDDLLIHSEIIEN